MNKVVMITGVTGQDGSYLAEMYIERGDIVVGIKRRTATPNTQNIQHLLGNENFRLVEGDITDLSCVCNLIYEWEPDYLINTAAQSHVQTSFEQPQYTFQVNAIGVLNCLEGVRLFSPHTRFYNCGTSEEYGSNYKLDENGKMVQDETVPLDPNSPYGCAKVAARHLVKVYRESYDIWACTNWLFNHESKRRSPEFVTRKVTQYVSKLKMFLEKQDQDIAPISLSSDEENIIVHGTKYPKLRLGNLDAVRDWGHSKDFCRAIMMTLEQDEPHEYVICTGVGRTIRELCEEAFKHVGIDNWTDFVMVDPKFCRPMEVPFLQGDNTKAKEELGWEPEIIFTELIGEMIKHDYKTIAGRDLTLRSRRARKCTGCKSCQARQSK